MRILTCPPGTEVLGLMLGTFADNFQGAETRPVMEKHNVVGLDPHAWYPLQRLLDALNELTQEVNMMSNFVAIGMGIGATVPIPPSMQEPTLEQVLMIWDDLYQGLHRGGDVGGIKIEKVTDTLFKTIHSVVYPDDMSYGVLYGYGRRFLPPGTMFNVFYDPEVTPRDDGGEGDATYINIKWDAPAAS